VELALLLALADLTSFWTALLVVVVTGLVGTMLVRAQGFRAYGRIHEQLSRGEMPTDALIDALCILVAGALLLTPGMLTDAFGFSLLIPACRTFYRRGAARWFRAHFHVQVRGFEDSADESDQPRSRVVETHFVPHDDEKAAKGE
jgi:UPF0716 protein FxsA